MKVVIKTLLLILAISLAIGGIMFYAKTKVDPPIVLEQIDQFSIDLATASKALVQVKDDSREDSIFSAVIDRIYVYQMENKFKSEESNKWLDDCTSVYSSLFIHRCFFKFNNSVWFDKDHSVILNSISQLRALSHDDKTSVLTSSVADSLNLIVSIISDYRDARQICRHTEFTGIDNVQYVINQSDRFSSAKYLNNCRELMTSLANVRSNIESSHYNYVFSQVEKLSEYRYFSESYYEKDLVPHVEVVISEYDRQAQSLYRRKQNVNTLWERASNYIDQAIKYYHAQP